MSTNSDKQGQFGLSEIVRLKRVTDSPGKYRVRAPAEFTPSTDGSVSKALPGPWSFKNVHDYYAALAAPDQSREHFTNNRSSVRLAHPSGKSGACVHAFGTKYKPEDKQTYRGKEIKSFSTAYDAEKHSIHNASSAQGDESDTSAKAEVTTALTDGQDPVKRMLVDVILRQKGADEWVTMRDQGTFDLQISSPSSTERSASLKRSPLIKRVMTSSPVYAAYEEERLYSETDRLRKPTRLPSVCDLQFERLQCPEYRSQGFLVDPAKDDGYSCGLPQCVDRYRATFNYKASDMGDKDLSVNNTERGLAEQTFAEDFVPPTAYTCGLRAAKVRHLNLDTEGDMQQFNTNVPGVYQHLHRYFTGDASDPVESVHVPDNASLFIGERKVKDGDEGVPVLAMLKKLPNAQDTEYGKSTYLHGQVWSAPTEASGGMWDVSKGSFKAIVSEPHERAEQATWARLAGSAYEARGATSSAILHLRPASRVHEMLIKPNNGERQLELACFGRHEEETRETHVGRWEVLSLSRPKSKGKEVAGAKVDAGRDTAVTGHAVDAFGSDVERPFVYQPPHPEESKQPGSSSRFKASLSENLGRWTRRLGGTPTNVARSGRTASGTSGQYDTVDGPEDSETGAIEEGEKLAHDGDRPPVYQVSAANQKSNGDLPKYSQDYEKKQQK